MLSLPILPESRCSFLQKHQFLETSKNLHSKGRYQEAEEHHCCTPKPHLYFSILKPSGGLSTEQKRQRAGQGAPRHWGMLRHRRPKKCIYHTARCSLPTPKEGGKSVLFKFQPSKSGSALQLCTKGRRDVCRTQLHSHTVEFI